MSGAQGFLLRMPAGIPGECTRGWGNSIIETQVITPTGTTGAPTAYGVPMVVDNTAGNIGNMRTMVAGDTPAVGGLLPYGVLIRPFPTQSASWPQDTLGTSTPPTQGPCDILKSGYCTVLLSGTTAAAKGGQVYIWTAVASGAHIQGGFEATNPSGSGILYIGAYFMGAADASGNVEIAINP
jgi:hypothetical protein